MSYDELAETDFKFSEMIIMLNLQRKSFKTSPSFRIYKFACEMLEEGALTPTTDQTSEFRMLL